MIQREVIEIQNYTKGTKIVNFFGVDHVDFQDFPLGYLITDFAGKPLKVVDNEFELNSVRLPNNSFKYDSTIKYITGKTSTQTLNYELTEEEKKLFLQRFIDKNKTTYGKDNVYWSMYSPSSINDVYANVSFIKSFNTLNTLSVINSTEGETTYKESLTGVLFGKLESIQKISDESGNKIKIPLFNVPVAIFKTTDEFPDISSTDENGNRIVLNVKENSEKSKYFNEETYNFASQFLTSTEQFKNIPDKYRYTAMTNEKGEFIIYDVPVGAQTFMFEVDLLKQGMTKDEVALNNFPYQTTENPNVDNIPHLFFRQFSINVVPSWSDLQSGYTQLNITVPIDLRKWTTYIFPPVAFGNEKLEITVAKNTSRKFKIDIRDMTVKGFPEKTISLVKVSNDLDKDIDSQYAWYGEFAENRKQVEFSEFGCYVLKLPANLYDPDGFKTNQDGIPTQNKGVWLSSYQLRESIDITRGLRATGGHSYWTPSKGFLFISHYDLNLSIGNEIDIPTTTTVGKYPYEKPWTINYPTKYSIPAKPINQRFGDSTKRLPYSNGNYYMEEPAYSDGDLVGAAMSFVGVSGNSGGFGIQYIPNSQGGDSVFFVNRIAAVATRNYMYKYEKGVSWNETYANGYMPFFTVPAQNLPFAGQSTVKNGETYQRLECGYGYFMKPQGWPRYVRNSNGVDVPAEYITSPTVTPIGMVGNMYSTQKWYNDVFNLENNQNYALALNGAEIKNSGIDIYRIVQSGIGNVQKAFNFVIPTYCRLKINWSPLAYAFSLKNTGEITVLIENKFRDFVWYYDETDTIRKVEKSGKIHLFPGKIMFMNGGDDTKHGSKDVNLLMDKTALILPSNSNYNTDLNQYTRANYTFGVSYKDTIFNGNGNFSFDFAEDATPDIPTFWVRTHHGGGKNGIISDGISKYYYYGSTYYDVPDKYPVQGIIYEQTNGDLLPEMEGNTPRAYGYPL